jgi:endonuclease YncB( thermonuclease family)
MNRFRLAAFLVLFLAFLSAHAAILTERVVRVLDGDTVFIRDAEKVRHKIRLCSGRLRTCLERNFDAWTRSYGQAAENSSAVTDASRWHPEH